MDKEGSEGRGKRIVGGTKRKGEMNERGIERKLWEEEMKENRPWERLT